MPATLTRLPDLVFVDVNEAYLRLLGYDRDEVVGKTSLDVAAYRDRALTSTVIEWLLRGGDARAVEQTLYSVSGERVVVLSSMDVVSIEGQDHILTFMHDITERARAEAAERGKRALAEALCDTAAALGATLDSEHVLDRLLESIGRVVRHDAAEIALIEPDGETLRTVRSRGATETVHQEGYSVRHRLAYVPGRVREAMIRQGQPAVLADVGSVPAWIREEGMTWETSYAGAPIRSKGQVIGLVSVYADSADVFTPDDARHLQALADQASVAMENAQLYAEAEALAVTDPLTGLFNRRGLETLGRREVDRVRRFGQPLCALMLDVDHFKDINDRYGHRAGDRVLTALASCCREEVRDIDIVARYGGEEFVVLLPETDISTATQVAERLRRRIAEMNVSVEDAPNCGSVIFGAGPREALVGSPSRETVRVTVSLGIAEFTPELLDLAGLLERADQALYCAKSAGRDRVAMPRT